MGLNTLQNKIWLAIIVVIALFAPFIFLYFPHQQEKLLIDSYQDEVQSISNAVALGVQIALTEQNFQGVQMAMEHAKEDSRLVFIAMIQIDTILREGKTITKKAVFNSYPENYEVDPNVLNINSMIIKSSPVYTSIFNGEIIVGFSTDPIQAIINEVRYTLVIGSLIISILGLLTGLLLARNITKPLMKLMKATNKVAEGDLSQQVEIGSGDEFGQLAESFNVMVQHVQGAEEKLQKANREIRLLLKEMHHRVKNNLQIISSLLNMQASKMEDELVVSAFRASQNRIQTMAYIHDNLYMNDLLSEISVIKYLEPLINDHIRSNSNSVKIGLETNLLDVNFSIDTMLPIGLLINEMLTNSIKHAFPNKKDGKITVSMLKGENNKLILRYGDNGIGFEQDDAKKTANSLGLILMETLSVQLEGELKRSNKKGTHYEITFEPR